ncbi:hypothetical protein CERSUDRAFT_97361 [Gelatoporia subvermispora B]|uniref:Uncharacterized protein n=1 Tax=Ceriporiopsis subvermispora (strain B) TaxID=914234 RepID=M2R7V3_CERS8|nr:hypothetical protein CERSUDRAFT_97361 [Gelatoporia subvermispora B]
MSEHFDEQGQPWHRRGIAAVHSALYRSPISQASPFTRSPVRPRAILARCDRDGDRPEHMDGIQDFSPPARSEQCVARPARRAQAAHSSARGPRGPAMRVASRSVQHARLAAACSLQPDSCAPQHPPPTRRTPGPNFRAARQHERMMPRAAAARRAGSRSCGLCALGWAGGSTPARGDDADPLDPARRACAGANAAAGAGTLHAARCTWARRSPGHPGPLRDP